MAHRFLINHTKNRLKIADFYFIRRSLQSSGFTHESSCPSALTVAARIRLTSGHGLSLSVFVARCSDGNGGKISVRTATHLSKRLSSHKVTLSQWLTPLYPRTGYTVSLKICRFVWILNIPSALQSCSSRKPIVSSTVFTAMFCSLLRNT